MDGVKRRRSWHCFRQSDLAQKSLQLMSFHAPPYSSSHWALGSPSPLSTVPIMKGQMGKKSCLHLELRCPQAMFAHLIGYNDSMGERPVLPLKGASRLWPSLSSVLLFWPQCLKRISTDWHEAEFARLYGQCNTVRLHLEELVSPNQMPCLIRSVDTDNALTSTEAMYQGLISNDKSVGWDCAFGQLSLQTAHYRQE